jgi:hypothetical protein
MKKSLLFILSLIVFAFTFGYAGPVDKTTAEKVAMNFCLTNPNVKNMPGVALSLAFTEKSIILSEDRTKDSETVPMFYIFNVNQNDGFVMVSADDEVFPVLGIYLFRQFYREKYPCPFSETHGIL